MVQNQRGIETWRAATGAWCCALALVCMGCIAKVTPGTGGGAPTTSGAPGATDASSDAQATVTIDGSSTVYPIAQAMAESYKAKHPNVDFAVGYAGTSGGFKRFLLGEIDLCNASRKIKEAEIEACKVKGIEYLELQIAVDGLTVVVNSKNDWVQCLTIAQLKQLWEPESKITKWNELDPGWPAEKIELFGADVDSGTFEYFTEVVNGKAKACRTDYTPSANDNVLVRGVSTEKFSLGYFGFGYYMENKQKLKAVPIKATADADCVSPTLESIESGHYHPMSRPLFVYVNKKSLGRPEIADLLQFMLSDEGQQQVVVAKYIRPKSDDLQAMRQRLDEALAK